MLSGEQLAIQNLAHLMKYEKSEASGRRSISQLISPARWSVGSELLTLRLGGAGCGPEGRVERSLGGEPAASVADVGVLPNACAPEPGPAPFHSPQCVQNAQRCIEIVQVGL